MASGRAAERRGVVRRRSSIRRATRGTDPSRRLKRVFAIEIERRQRCGGKLEVIAGIEEPALKFLGKTPPFRRDRLSVRPR